MKERHSSVLVFHDEYRELKQAKSGSSGRKRARATVLDVPENVEMFEHKDVKKFFPPTNCKVWKHRASNIWHFQCGRARRIALAAPGGRLLLCAF